MVGMGLGSLIALMVVHRMIRWGFRDPGRIASHVLDRMRDDLDLTDEQAAKVLPAPKKHFAGIRDAIRGSHDAMHEEIEPLLTPEQFVEHKRISTERKARLFGHGRSHHKDYSATSATEVTGDSSGVSEARGTGCKLGRSPFRSLEA